MLSRIVVGSDGSSAAAQAVAYAAGLAKMAGAALTIVHAYREQAFYGAWDPAMGDIPQDVAHPTGRREEVLASLEAEIAGAKESGVEEVTSAAREGDPAHVILDVAEETGADLIVVGSKGMTGASRFLLGSVPNKVAHHAQTNVLVVHTS